MIQPLQPPAGFEVVAHRGRHWVVRETARDALLALPVAEPTDFGPDGDVQVRPGRARHASVPTEVGRVVIRAGRRGGMLGRFVSTWYLAIGTPPRPLRELCVSAEARAAGVPTPEVLAAVWERGGLGRYRAWVIVHEIPDALPFAHLWSTVSNAQERRAAVQAAAAATAKLHDAGIVHPDLNATNILLQRADGAWRAWIIDLDGAHRVGTLTPQQRARALWRLVRSCTKHQAAGVPIPGLAAAQFLKAYLHHAACGPASMRTALRSTRPWFRAKWWLSDALHASRPLHPPPVSCKTSP